MQNYCLQLFARAPEPGKVKTRLVSELGKQGACDLYVRLLQHVASVARGYTSQSGCDMQLWTPDEPEHPFLARLSREHGFDILAQKGEDLGKRMWHSAGTALEAGYSRVVIIGADCVSIDGAYLEQAFAALDNSDVVIGPAEDGGYVLIGFSSILPGVFDGVHWGGPAVMEQTCHNLEQTDLKYHLLETKWDVDTPADVEKLIDTGIMTGPELPIQ